MAELTHSCEWKNCSQTFQAKADLGAHRKTAHNGKFQCDTCEAVYSRHSVLFEHKKSRNHWTSRDPVFPCSVEGCTVPPFRRNVDLRNHKEQSHPDQVKSKRLKCYFAACESTFPTAWQRNKHEESYHKTNLPCTFAGCGARFDTESAHSAHVSAHESDDLHFMCNDEHCEARFESVEEQLSHEEIAHNRSTCSICSLSFYTQEDLASHGSKVHSSYAGLWCAHCRHHFVGKTAAAYALRHMNSHIREGAFVDRPFRIYEVAEGRKTLTLLEDLLLAPANASAKAPSAIGLVRASNMVARVEEFFSKLVGPAVLSDAPVAEKFTVRRSLQRFKDHLLSVPDLIESGSKLGVPLMKLLESPPLRSISFEVTSEDDRQWITFSTPDDLEFSVSHPGLDDSAIYTLAGCLCDILSRVPVSVLDLNHAKRRWLLKAAYIHATKVYSGDSNSPFAFAEPSLLEDESKQLYYSVPITGFDPAIARKWTFEQRIYVRDPQDKLDSDVARREVSVYQWQRQDVPSSLDTSLVSEVQLQKSLNMAKLIYCRYNGWIGNIYGCEKAANDLRGYTGKSELAGLKMKTNTKPLITMWRQRYQGFELRANRQWQNLLSVPEHSMAGFYLPTDDPEHIYNVVSSLVEAISNGHSPDVAWGIFCAAGDTEHERIRCGEPPIPIVSCTGCENGTHLCPTCLCLRNCDSFVESLEHDYKICSQCNSDEIGDVNLFTKIQAAGSVDSLATNLEKNLKALIARDIKASAGRLAIEGETLEDLRKEAFKGIKGLFIDEDTVTDNLVDQELHHHADTKRNWYGARHHPSYPSIDAFLRVVRGFNSQVMYHSPGNINITSDSVNRLFRHFPKFLGHGIRCMASADKYEDYIKGLRLFQSALINDYEMGVLASPNRSKYLGLPCDDFKNFDQVVDALLSCKPLPRTVAKSVVWRTRMTTGLAPQDIEQWKFDDFEYVMAQIRLAAKKYNLDTPELERTWLRDGKFFPFAQDSIVSRWTHWDCFQYFAEKLERMRNDCDRLFKNQANRPSCSVQELMIAVAHLHMAKVARDLKEGIDFRMCGRDQAGLILYPILNWLLSASIGHDEHGQQMLIGLTGYNPQEGTNCIFDPDKCNILWETWACNSIKWCYHRDYYPEIFAQLKKLRENPVSNSPVPFASAEEVFSNIRDLTNELASEVDGGTIDPESTYFPEDDQLLFPEGGEEDETLFIPEGDDEDDEAFEKFDESDFIFRCPCGVVESPGVSSRLIICCRECGEFQHKQCMGIAPDEAPRDHECDLCDEERYFGADWSAVKKPQSRFRCPCGGTERVDFPTQPIVRCEMCGEWQHRACFNIPTDATNLDHACEQCDVERYKEAEAVLRAGTASAGVLGPDAALGRPARRNMGRLNQTCFISAATQLLLAIPQASSIIAGENTCRPITGRDPKIMPLNFEEFEKVGRLFRSLKNVYTQLLVPGGQLERSLTGTLLQHSTTLQDSKDMRRWRDIPDNASEYFMYLIEKLVCVSDTSSYDTLHGDRTAQYNFEKELEARSADKRLDDLEKDIKTAITAYQSSGHLSDLAEALTVHMVRESECVVCGTILRKFQHDTSLVLKLPEHVPFGMPLSLSDLMKPFYEQCLGSQGPCQHCHLSIDDIEANDPAEKWRRFSIRILNAPEILIFEIDRLRADAGLGKNRVHTDTVLDLKDLQSDTKRHSRDNYEFALGGETRYERVGMLAYLGDFKHWIACIKEERGKTGRSILYDDTKPFPQYKSPEEITDPGFCECLIVYRKIKESGESEEPLVEGLDASRQSGHGGTTGDIFGDDGDIIMFEDLNIGTEKAERPQLEDDESTSSVTKSPLSTPQTTEQKLERALKKLAETENTLQIERLARISAEQDLAELIESGGSFDAHREFEHDLRAKGTAFLHAAGIDTDTTDFDSWLQPLDDARKEVETVKEVLRRLGIEGLPLSLNADTILEALRQSDLTSSPPAVEQLDTQLDRLTEADIRTVMRSAVRRLSSDDSMVSTFDAIYRELIAPAIANSDDPLRAWDVANERMIRPMLSSLARVQLKKAQPPSPGVTAAQSQKSKIPVPVGRTQHSRLSTSTLTDTKERSQAREYSRTGETTGPKTPTTVIRRDKSVRFHSSGPTVSLLGSELGSSPPTSREYAGESSRKRSAGKDRFAGETLGDGSKRPREGEDTSGSDYTQDSPLLDRAKRLEEAARQQEGIEKGSTRPVPQPGPPKWNPPPSLKKKGSMASFLQPTESSRGKDVRWNRSTTSLLSTYDDRTLTQNPLRQTKPKTDYVGRLKSVFKTPKKPTSSRSTEGQTQDETSSKEGTEDVDMAGEEGDQGDDAEDF